MQVNSIKCPECSAHVHQDDRFCPYCGVGLEFIDEDLSWIADQKALDAQFLNWEKNEIPLEKARIQIVRVPTSSPNTPAGRLTDPIPTAIPAGTSNGMTTGDGKEEAADWAGKWRDPSNQATLIPQRGLGILDVEIADTRLPGSQVDMDIVRLFLSKHEPVFLTRATARLHINTSTEFIRDIREDEWKTIPVVVSATIPEAEYNNEKYEKSTQKHLLLQELVKKYWEVVKVKYLQSMKAHGQGLPPFQYFTSEVQLDITNESLWTKRVQLAAKVCFVPDGTCVDAGNPTGSWRYIPNIHEDFLALLREIDPVASCNCYITLPAYTYFKHTPYHQLTREGEPVPAGAYTVAEYIEKLYLNGGKIILDDTLPTLQEHVPSERDNTILLQDTTGHAAFMDGIDINMY